MASTGKNAPHLIFFMGHGQSNLHIILSATVYIIGKNDRVGPGSESRSKIKGGLARSTIFILFKSQYYSLSSTDSL